MHKAQRLINHVALVLDGSSSMTSHTSNLINVADDQIKHLALRSEELQQETRVSVYLFADRVDCLIFDMDVMRLPSISDLYRAYGMTALIDAAIKSQEDLATTSQLYGDHAFLTFVLTDGAENKSRHSYLDLSRLIDRMQENWTIGFLVPDSQGEAYVSRIGVPKGNIARWDTSSAAGLTDAVSTIRTATDTFMVNRASGIRGSRNVFSTGAEAVNKRTVSAHLAPLDAKHYALYNVLYKVRIDEFVTNTLGRAYRPGIGYYQLTKTENIQPQKQIIVVEKRTNKAYSGPEARHLIGLPDDKVVRVRPDHNPEYDIFVQSTSLNRNLMPGTRLLVRN
jgi:hypothetical protein